MKLTREIIKRLPKTDLHVHLDGSVRINTIFELAKKHKVDLPEDNPEDLKKNSMLWGILCQLGRISKSF